MKTLINNVYCINANSISYLETDIYSKTLYAALNNGMKVKLFYAPTQEQLMEERIKIREWLNNSERDEECFWISAGHVDFNNNYDEHSSKNAVDLL